MKKISGFPPCSGVIMNGKDVLSVSQFREFLMSRMDPTTFVEMNRWIEAYQSERSLQTNDQLLNDILAVVSKEAVYSSISSNLVPIRTKFQDLRRQKKLEVDLSWRAIESILDDHSRVVELFKDAFDKKLLGILGEALLVKLKRIHDMFGSLLY